MERLLADARKQLVETGTRNRLVHVNRDNKRAKVVNVVNERSDDIYDLLRIKRRKMRFKATGRDKNEDGEDGPQLALLDEPFDEGRYTDNDLETDLGPEAQAKRLLGIARDARTAEEEQGVNILYLALGFLTWFEDKVSAVQRNAPLILLPVDLVRDAKTSRYDLRARDDDLVTNLPLAERLRTDFGIELPELDTSAENWAPSGYFDAVVDAVSAKDAWSVDRDGMQLGFFSFAKFLMLRDLDPENWPGPGLGGSEIVDTLLAGNFKNEPPLFAREEPLDPRLAPADLVHVVDADASQTKVIEEVRAGRNLVVQGPPGTGKSQTIANIIASAVHDGRTVLFVAEKMAALSVVHDRLRAVGLESVCLELHSRSANKKAVLHELARTMAAGADAPAEPNEPAVLTHLRDTLNAQSQALHAPVNGLGLTPYEALATIVRLVGRGVPAPTLEAAELAERDGDRLREDERALHAYAAARDRTGEPPAHPFFAVRDLSLQPMDLARLENEARTVHADADRLVRGVETLAAWLDMPADTPSDIARIVDVLETLHQAPAEAAEFIDVVSRTEGSQLANGLRAGIDWQNQREVAATVVDAAWQADIASLRSGIASGVGSFFARWGSRYRSASRELATLLKVPLPDSARERLALCDALVTAGTARAHYIAQAAWMERALGTHWQRDATPFARIEAVSSWLARIRRDGLEIASEKIAALLAKSEQLDGFITYLREERDRLLAALESVDARLSLDLTQRFGKPTWGHVPIAKAGEAFERIATEISRYDEWAAREGARRALDGTGLVDLRTRIDAGALDADGALDELRFAHAEAAWKRSLVARPELNEIARADRHALVDAFQEAENDRREDVRRLVASRHLNRLPTGDIGSMGVIRGEIGKRRNHKPVRKLIEQAGDAVQRLKPVFMMSPISLAQFVAPGGLRFDLLVIDEASQVKPADALGAIARCDQIVIVGDKQQLPPTAFFDRMTGNTDDEEEEDDPLGGAARATELESVLTLCEARNLPSRMLEWHYRSRDPSLIAVSNREFYGSGLVLPPSPLQHDAAYGLRFVPAAGAYTSGTRGTGRPGTNRIEAEALTDAVAAHAREMPDLSLGIVTFSSRQRDMVTEVLEAKRREDETLDAFLREGRREDVFVKNIENVQGDERDVILISVAYGPLEPGGRLASMSFGPINSDGGERRLNVLFSRARIRCDVFCSFDPGDIDLSRTRSDGVRVLKRFLDYAKDGQLDQAGPTGELPDSPFEEDVADVVRRLGYDVDHQVGSAGFRIDLGVRNPQQPGRYMLAIECDGATYHSALWARERDRLRQEVLEHLGWTVHRIWSTDWFHRRDAEIDRLRERLAQAADAAGQGIVLEGANTGNASRMEEEPEDSSPDEFVIPEAVSVSVPYTMADVSVRSPLEPHEAPVSETAGIVRRIVEVEGPIHEEEVARRLASAYGKERTGSRILQAARRGLKTNTSANDEGSRLYRDGPFWFTATQRDEPPIRDRTGLPAGALKADMLPPMEIRAAAQRLQEENGAADRDELVRAIARTFGFDRVGKSLRQAIADALPDDGRDVSFPPAVGGVANARLQSD